LGGTFEGWAAAVGKDRAVEVLPGRLTITPFLGTSTLTAQTLTLDVLINPGGAPVDEVALTTSPMWTADRRPIAPEAIAVTLVPIRHFTVYDEVTAIARLQYGACTVEERFVLADRDAVRPPLWDIGIALRGDSRSSWLALYDSVTGPVRVIFTNPAVAAGFSTWLRQTGARRLGKYELGVIHPVESDNDEPTARFEHFLMGSFQPISADELSVLRVGPLGEP
jgi:hypothetical protein